MANPCGPNCAEWKKTKELRAMVIMEAYCPYGRNACEHEEEILAASKEINAEIKRWSDLNFRNIQGYYCLSKYRGHSAETKTLKIMVFGCAGRLMVTIQDRLPKGKGKYDGAWLSIVGPDDPKDNAKDGDTRTGLQGLAATRGEALALLRDSMEMPYLLPDKKISII